MKYESRYGLGEHVRYRAGGDCRAEYTGEVKTVSVYEGGIYYGVERHVPHGLSSAAPLETVLEREVVCPVAGDPYDMV